MLIVSRFYGYPDQDTIKGSQDSAAAAVVGASRQNEVGTFCYQFFVYCTWSTGP